MERSVNRFIRDLKRRGWFLKRQNKHVVMGYIPGGQISFSSSPSDTHWVNQAWRDAWEIEKKYGKYIVPKEKRKEFGLDYRHPDADYTPQEERDQPIVIDEEILVPETIMQCPPTTIQQPKQEDAFMSTLDKDLLIELLQEKYDQLRPMVEPYLAKFAEYQRVERQLQALGRIDKPDEEKIAEAVAKGVVTKVAPTRRASVRSIDLYNDIISILKTEGRMKIKDLTEFLVGAGGYNFGYPNSGVTPAMDLTNRIRHAFPENLKKHLHLSAEGNWCDGWIEYKQEQHTQEVNNNHVSETVSA